MNPTVPQPPNSAPQPAATPTPAAAAPEPKSGITHTGIETILVVEDEQMLAKVR